MSRLELAIDGDGEPFDVPAHVTGWRIRRLQPDGRGRPELVYDATGRPVVLPVDATFVALRDTVGGGRYRLDPIDASGHVDATVKTACTGYVQPVETSNDGAIASPRGKVAVRAGNDDLVVELARTNIRLAELVVGSIPAILAATGGLITAADGANLTTRKPPPDPPPHAEPELEDDDDDDDGGGDEYGDDAVEEAEPPAQGGWVSGLVEAIAPMVIGLVKSGAKLPGGLPIEALFDWRKARPDAAPEASAPEPSQGEAAGPAEVAATAEALASEHAGAGGSMHLLAIWQGLSPEEQQRAQALVGRLTVEERTAWMAELAALTVPEAVARVRHIIRPHMPATTAAHSGTPTSEGKDGATMAAAASRPAPTSGVPGQSSAGHPTVGVRLGSIFATTAPTRQQQAKTITGAQTATAAPASRTHAATSPATAAPAGTVPEAQGTAERVDPAAGRADPAAGRADLAASPATAAEQDVRALEAHLVQIWGALSANERVQAQTLMEQLTGEQRTVWAIELGSLSVPEAVDRVRAALQLLMLGPKPADATVPGEPQAAGSTTSGAS